MIIYIDQRPVHYEVFGRGQPIIFLHSWFGSWRYWVPAMDVAGERYRAYALDFWGFGESDRHGEGSTVSDFVTMLIQFMDGVGIQQPANLVGHGLGGMVAVQAAREYPKRFNKLMTVGTPLYGSVLQAHIKPGTFSLLLGRNSPASIWTGMLRKMPITDNIVRQELVEDTDSLSPQLLSDVQNSMLDTDLRPALGALELPLLGVYGEKDTIVPADHGQLLNDMAERPYQYLMLPRASHFPFLDERASIFNRVLMDFLASQGSPVEIKENWKRKVNQREYL
ncbi:MAG: alpha/beta hydrolase [Chloroflexaceae bacterium]|jgi:pimeloyl-ACP methyl ester carboxylesterase|nr:alpha/beta hydrolase [Chloroflexaceae bacterium]